VQTRNKGEGIDIMLCMDISGSMLSTDFYPNRLEAAKQMAAEFVKQRPIDQIGLVIFSGESYAQVPLSADHETLLEQINSLQSGMLHDGTLIGEGLATAVGRLVAGKAKSKVAILLTDGKEEPPPDRIIDPLTALEIAKREAVKVYTIGMDAGTGTVVTESSPAKSPASGLDEALLRRIGTETGGVYFRATDKEGLQDVYNEINRLEKSKVEVVTKTKFSEKAPLFIVAALFFLALELLLSSTYLRTFP
jgi:Ca-activated chloride channel family protein